MQWDRHLQCSLWHMDEAIKPVNFRFTFMTWNRFILTNSFLKRKMRVLHACVKIIQINNFAQPVRHSTDRIRFEKNQNFDRRVR